MIENENFKKNVIKFILCIEINGDNMVSVTGENELFPAIFTNKNILDKSFKDEIELLKSLNVIK